MEMDVLVCTSIRSGCLPDPAAVWDLSAFPGHQRRENFSLSFSLCLGRHLELRRYIRFGACAALMGSNAVWTC